MNTSVPGEKIIYDSLPVLPGVEIMWVSNCLKKWRFYTESRLCIGIPTANKPWAEYLYRR